MRSELTYSYRALPALWRGTVRRAFGHRQGIRCHGAFVLEVRSTVGECEVIAPLLVAAALAVCPLHSASVDVQKFSPMVAASCAMPYIVSNTPTPPRSYP